MLLLALLSFVQNIVNHLPFRFWSNAIRTSSPTTYATLDARNTVMKESLMGTVMVSIRIPSDLNDRYMQLVKETGRLRSFYINEVLAESIDRLEYEYGVLRQIKACRAGRL